MNATHDDGLLHALQGHTEEEESSDLNVARQVHENSSQRRDLPTRSFRAITNRCNKRNSQSSSLLKVLNCVANVSEFWRLDSSSKDLFRLVLAPELDLED